MIANKKRYIILKNTYIAYTIMFAFVFALCFIYYFLNNKTFIWPDDAIGIYLKKIIWFRRYVIDLFKNFFIEHTLELPMWEFGFGEGTDIFQGFSGNVIGDPIAIFSLFFNEKNLAYYWGFSQSLRVYLSGLSFVFLCKTLRKSNNLAIVSGAITYAFCCWNLINIGRHHGFLNFNFYLPIFLAGYEIVINKNKPTLYIITLACMLSHDLYTSWQVAIFMIIYIPLRCIAAKYNFRFSISIILKISFYSIISLLISAYLSFPFIKLLLVDSRTGISRNFQFLYTKSYYFTLLRTIISYGTSKSVFMGFSVTSFVATILLFTNKNYKLYLKVLFVVCLIFLTFPFFGKLMNGFSYVTNRWSWMIALPFSYVLTDQYDNFFNDDKIKIITVVVFLYFTINTIFDNINDNFIVEFALLMITLLYVYLSNNNKFSQIILLLITILSVVCQSYYLNSPSQGNYINQLIRYDEYNDLMYNTQAKSVSEINDDEYFRFSAFEPKYANEGLVYNLPTNTYATSLTNPFINMFFNVIGAAHSNSHNWANYDKKVLIDALMGIKYIVTKNKNNVPFGYDFFEKKEYGDVYLNRYALPLLYSYGNTYIDEDSFDKYNFVEKQEIMCMAPVLDNYHGNILKKEKQYNCKSVEPRITFLPYGKVDKNNVIINNNSIITHRPNSKILIKTNGIKQAENHLMIKNFDFTELKIYDLYFNKNYVFRNNEYNIDPNNKFDFYNVDNNTQDIVLKSNKLFYNERANVNLVFTYGNNRSALNYYTSANNSYGNFHNFDINLGYQNDSVDSIVINLPYRGIYSFDSIKYSCLPLDKPIKDILKLNDDDINNIEINKQESIITAIIDSEIDKFVCCTMPYYPGWKAYIDGKEVKLYRTNIRHMGIDVPAGKHTIEFRYKNFYFIYGCFISIFGLLMFIGLIVYNKKKDKEYGYY